MRSVMAVRLPRSRTVHTVWPDSVTSSCGMLWTVSFVRYDPGYVPVYILRDDLIETNEDPTCIPCQKFGARPPRGFIRKSRIRVLQASA